MRAAKITWMVWGILLTLTFARAQRDQHLFFNYTPEQGLIDNSVSCFLKDSNGFLWIGTNSGLSKFDGFLFANYVCNPADSNSISGNHIVNLFEDASGVIWVSTHENGLNAYNPATNKFRRYNTNSAAKRGVPNNSPTSVCMDSMGRMWVGFFGEGIALYNPNDDSFTLTSFDSNSGLYNFNEILDMEADSGGIFWISTRVGLVRFDPITGIHQRIEQLEADGTKLSEKNLFLKVHLSPEGQIYIGSWVNGIYAYNPKTAEWRQFLVDKTKRENKGYANKINDFIFVSPDRVLFTSYYFGFGFLNCNTGEVDYFSPESNQSTKTLGVESGYSVYKTDDLIFLGTHEGFSRMTSRAKAIREFDGSSLKYPFENGVNVISSFIPDAHDSTLFIGTYYRDGLYSFSRNTGRLLSNIPLKNNSGPLIINVIQPSRITDKRYYIASSKGLLVFDAKEPNALDRLQIGNDISTSGFIWAMDYDSRGVLWFSSGDALYAWNESSGTLENHTDDFKKLSGLTAFRFIQIFVDNKDQLWCITDDRQLYVYSPSGQSFVRFNCDAEGRNKLSGSAETILQDAAGNMWISMSSTGLAFYDTRMDTVRYLTSKDGLLNARIVSLAQDESGNIWALSNRGLSVVNSSNFLVRNFTKRQGLELADANVIEYHKGLFYLGGRDYAWIINPEELLNKQNSGSIYITEIITASAHFDNLNTAFASQEISLAHGDNYITIHFTVPDISSEIDYYYYTKIEGVDSDWILAGKEGEVTYSGLNDGEYVIRLKAKNGSGEWCTEERVISLSIQPPFWKRAWFFIPFIVLIALGVVVLNRQRVKLIRRKAEEKSAIRHQLTELENKALRSQMNPHFIFNSLNSINSYIIKNHTDEASAFVTKFARLIRLILDNSMDNVVLLERELMALSLYIEIESKRFEKKFTWEIELSPEIQSTNFWLPPMVIQPYVENAIWHGLLHKDPPGMLKVTVNATNNWLEIQIRDNGVGRKAAIELKSKTTLKTKSHGLEVTKKRIANFNEDYGISESVSIQDLADDAGNPSGTLVILKLAKVVNPNIETKNASKN